MAITTKGQGPANLKKRMDTLFAKLDEAYPDKIIVSLQKDHKKWAETVTELYRTLGYPDGNTFLEAYGYAVQKGKAGRPGNNHMEIIQELQHRYPEGSPYQKVSDLQEANGDLKMKTLNNNAQALFGMSLADYLQSIGLLRPQDFRKDLDDLAAQLRLRYPDPKKRPKTVAEVKAQNPDLPVQLLAYAGQHGISAKEYLQQAEVLQPDAAPEKAVVRFEKEPIDEKLIQEYLSILQKRYAGKSLPKGIRNMARENPDLAVNRIHTHLRKNLKEPVEKFYIRNGIFEGLPTDLNTYIFCKVELDVGRVVWAFGIEDIDQVQVGERVRTDYDWTRKNGVLLEKITCLGLDAPYPVKDINVRCLGREIPTEETVRKVSSGQVIPNGYQVVDRAEFDYPDAKDLSQCNIQGIPVYDLAQIRFRGYREEMDKLCAFLKVHCLNAPCREIQGGIWELQAKGWYLKECYLEILRYMPALKITGLLEALGGSVYVFYSESGAGAVTACQYCGSMDWKSDHPDSRWANYIDMTSPHQGRFTHIQTSEPVSVNYQYPFLTQWNDLNYVREKDGVLYRKGKK